MRKIIGFILGIFSPFFLATPAFAIATKVEICPPKSEGVAGELCALGTDVNALQKLIRFSFTSIFIVATLIAIFFLIFGGVKWIISGGDKTAIEGARNTIVAAIVGLVIIFVAFIIVNVLGTAFGVKIFEFTIPTIQ